jgi:hypothetical protein
MLSSFLSTLDLLKRIEDKINTSCIVTAAVKTEDLSSSLCLRITEIESGISIQKIFDYIELVCEMEISEEDYIQCLASDINDKLAEEFAKFHSLATIT